MLWSKAIGAGGNGGVSLLTISPALSGQTKWDGVSPLVFPSFGEYTVVPNVDTTVAVKMWGAGGACGYAYNGPANANQGPGAGGGYSSANIQLLAGVSYVFRIGQGGIRSTIISTVGATYLAGGARSSAFLGAAQGGGYSGIFSGSVTQANALLMAGGGGAGYDNNFSGRPGAGGGLQAQASSDNQSGKPGTQTSGGAPSQYNGATAGGALIGGLAAQASGATYHGGGGGGYYGGGGGNIGGGGGGSGRIGSQTNVTSGVTTAGLNQTPANSGDTDRNGAGFGGSPSPALTAGADGRIKISFVS